jgi:hypothetical protein
MKSRAVTLLAIALIATSTSCGLVTHGTKQTVFIDSMPTGASIEVDGTPTTTPAWVRLSRRNSHAVLARNAQGAIVWRPILTQTDWTVFVFDLVTVPVVFHVIDVACGSLNRLEPASLTIPLPPPDAGPEYRSLPKAP